jgi:hypothetical protein
MNAQLIVQLAIGLSRVWFTDTAQPPQPRVIEQALPVAKAAAFRETRTVTVAAEHGSILGFVPDGAGGLVIVSGQQLQYGGAQRPQADGPIPNRLVWMDATGAEQRAVELSENPRGLNRAEDGWVYVVGNATVAWYDAAGQLLGSREAPHFVLPEDEYEAFTEEAVERRDLSLTHQETQLKAFEETLAAIEAKPEEERTPGDVAQRNSLQHRVRSQREAIEQRRAMTPDQLFDEAVSNAKQLYRVAVSKEHLFLVGRETFGYGYAVWRCDRECRKPAKIISGLSGCCGQMDIQVIGDRLAVAENSRHRVIMADFEGETVTSFGKRDRSGGAAGFSGCCNPMNTCRAPDGSLLTSESNGCVKRFASDGSFQEVVGNASVRAGCKNSTVGMAADGGRIYYLDITKGQIIVLEKPPAVVAQKD